MPENNEDLVSIVVPAYRRDDLLKLAILSVLEQTHRNWELLIIDDALSEKTQEVISLFRDKRIQYIRRPENKKGANACRNIGIVQSTGSFIMFLDSDDEMIHSCLEERVACFKKYPENDFLVFQTAFFKTDIKDATTLWNRFDEQDDLKRFLASDVVWHTSGSFFKRASLIKNNLKYHEAARSGQDWFFHLDVLLKGLSYTKIETIPDVFIRRDAAQKRISDEHGDTDKAHNRIELMKELFTRDEISSDAEKTGLLLKTVFREFFALMNTKRTIPESSVEYFSTISKNDKKSKKIIRQMVICNFLVGKQFLLYRIYKKFLFPSWIDNQLNNQSKYRSSMGIVEMENLKAEIEKFNILKSQND